MNEDRIEPPTAHRVAARAIAMVVVCCRGFVEADAKEAAEFWGRVLRWFESLGVEEELEAWEREAIGTPLGSLDGQAHANAQWLCEGLAVLAWALGSWDIPSHDVPVVAAEVSESLGFLSSKDETVLASPKLKVPQELERFRNEAFTVHWRLREFSLKSCAMDFRSFLEKAWFGPLELQEGALFGNDLRVGDQALAEAPASEVRLATSIARERHRAINWLFGESAIYSETDTST